MERSALARASRAVTPASVAKMSRAPVETAPVSFLNLYLMLVLYIVSFKM